jgi:glycosyltransferase involved in cell wall biosynthesis
MLEALGHGLPIVAADTEINREICQNSALYYSPQNDLDGARVLLSAFDVTTRQSLVEAGRKRFVSFDWSWQRYVQDFLKMVKSIL